MSEYKLYDFGQKFDMIDAEKLAEEAAAGYSAEVNLNRAIPDVRDGLKPVQRRALYGMYDLGLEPKKPHVKSARISGEVMGKYHPHGDSIYGAFALLAQPFAMNEVLVDGHGNFGSISGKNPAAQRYTESRLSNTGYLMVKDLKKDAVEMIPNFDGSEVEPRVLPTPVPQALLNGQMGIGWSIASSIAPHNINELMDLAIYVAKLNDKPFNLDEVKKIFKGPDMMTGCQIILNDEEYEKALTTGESKFIQRSVIEYHVDKKTSYFSIKHVPYKVRTDKLKEQIAIELSKSKAFGIESIEDNSKGSNLDIRFIFKKGTSEERLREIVNHLFKKTSLQESVSTNNMMIYKGRPTSIGIIKYMKIFNEFRLETLRNIWAFDKKALEKRLNVVNGLLRLEDVTDEVIKIARESKSKSHFKEMIIDKYDFNDEQAEYIASLQIYQLGRTNFDALRNELDEKTQQRDTLQLWLEDEKEAKKQLIVDLKATKKEFKGHDRKSEIINANDVEEVKSIKLETIIDDKPVKVVVKRDLEMFQIGSQAYQNQIDDYKEDDIVAVLDTRTVQYVMAITSDGQSVTRLVNDLPRIELNGRSEKLNKQVPDLKADDKFVGGCVLTRDNSKVILLSKNGYVKVMTPNTLSPKTTTKLYFKKVRQVAKTKDNDELVAVHQLNLSDFETHTLEVLTNDPTKKSGKTIKKLKLDKFADKSSGTGGAGSRSINMTSKKQVLEYVSSVVVKNEQEQVDQVEEVEND